jgi:hypothetical protein
VSAGRLLTARRIPPGEVEDGEDASEIGSDRGSDTDSDADERASGRLPAHPAEAEAGAGAGTSGRDAEAEAGAGAGTSGRDAEAQGGGAEQAVAGEPMHLRVRLSSRTVFNAEPFLVASLKAWVRRPRVSPRELGRHAPHPPHDCDRRQ